jgi:hypothetical protein
MSSTCEMSGCTKSTNIFKYECKCGKIYCIKHRGYEEHNCCFDIKKFDRRMIEKLNPVVVSDKVGNRI